MKDILKVPKHLPIANLPTLLKKGIEVIGNIEQQKLMTYCLITVLSPLLLKVQGTYDQKICFANLFLMALGHSGTGKGIIVHSRQVVKEIHKLYLKESEDQLKSFRKLSTKTKNEIPPPFKTVLIPGNTTQAKLLMHLSDNNPDVPSLIFETEMDTISNAIKSEHGNFSSILRNGFQNEPISKSIKQNSEYINIECPKPAIVLSGTPAQLFSFIGNREDGLLSRFLIMDFKGNDGWKNVAPCPGCINLTDYFQELSHEYLEFYKFISQDDLKVSLTERQWRSLESYGKEKLIEVSETHGHEAKGIVNRNGLILFKICMVLTSLRKFEDSNLDKEVFCTDEDFETALYLVDQSMYAVLDIYEVLPKTKQISSPKKTQFISSLPATFTRNEALVIANKFSIPTRTADRYLKDYLEKNQLSQKTKGEYLKTKIVN